MLFLFPLPLEVRFGPGTAVSPGRGEDDFAVKGEVRVSDTIGVRLEACYNYRLALSHLHCPSNKVNGMFFEVAVGLM